MYFRRFVIYSIIFLFHFSKIFDRFSSIVIVWIFFLFVFQLRLRKKISINQFVKNFQKVFHILFVNKFSTNNFNLTFSNNFVLLSKIFNIVFQFDVFRKIDHRYVSIISNELRFIFNVIVFTNFRSIVIRWQIRDNKTFFVQLFVYFSKWITIKSNFRIVAKIFYNQIVEYRQI